MAVALKAHALTTLATAKTRLGITDTSQDDTVSMLINAASAAIATYCHRKVQRETVIERQRVGGGVKVVVARPPLLSIVSIVVDDATVDATSYRIQDGDAGIVYFYSIVPWQGFRRPGIAQDLYRGTEQPDMVLTYDGGFVTPEQARLGAYAQVTLPDDLEQACLELVTTYKVTMGAIGIIASESIGDASVTYAQPWRSENDAIPTFIAHKLRPYKMIALGY